ncbi:MAG: CoA-binding protein [Candidatus Absconditabacterales bacterium]
MINKNFLYAVVGASNNEEKYGYKVFKDLLNSGYKVLPINPTEKEILGEKVYPTLSDVKQKIDVVIFVTQPIVTEKVLEQVKTLEIKNVWLQPGAQSDAAIEFCKKNMIECIHDACIMIQRKK